MDVREFNGRRLYSGLRLDYKLKLRLWAPASPSRAISAVAELLVCVSKLRLLCYFKPLIEFLLGLHCFCVDKLYLFNC